MTGESDDREFVERVRTALEQTAQRIDPETQARLTRARAVALEAGAKTGRRRWLPLSGLATVAAGLAALWLWSGAPKGPQIDTEELEILASSEELELLEDLEFYEWLDGESGRAPGPQSRPAHVPGDAVRG